MVCQDYAHGEIVEACLGEVFVLNPNVLSIDLTQLPAVHIKQLIWVHRLSSPFCECRLLMSRIEGYEKQF